MRNYLLSFHGLDIGLVYNLPKNVRIYMYCSPGEPMSAELVNEARTWRVATLPEYDQQGKFMTRLWLRHDGPGKESLYCTFSGNLAGHDLNRVPDLYFEEEEDNDFRTGLFELPCRFNRVFLRDTYSTTDRRRYQPGDTVSIDRGVLHRRLARFRDHHQGGFIQYFLEPSSLHRRRYAELPFVVVPDTQYFASYHTLRALFARRPPPRVPRSRMHDPTQDDRSVPNTHDPTDARRVMAIKRVQGGIYLSEIVRCLCAKYPDERITIIVSACRSFHDEVPRRVRRNQKKTARVSALHYYRDLADEDMV